MRKPSLRQVLFVELVIVALCMSSFGYVFSVPSSTFTLSSGVYPGAPSYTVWKEGATYYAKNANGALVYESTNASYVINNAITAASENSSILFESADYSIDSTLLFNRDYMTYRGESRDGVRFITTSDDYNAINITQGANTDMEHIEVSDFSVIGTGATNTNYGIYIYGLWHSIIENIEVSNFDYGFYLYGDAIHTGGISRFESLFSHHNNIDGIRTFFQYDSVWDMITVYNNNAWGLYIAPSTQGSTFKRVTARDNAFSNIICDGGKVINIIDADLSSSGQYGIFIGDGSTEITLDQVYEENAQLDGLYITSGSHLTAKSNTTMITISNSRFVKNNATGIKIDAKNGYKTTQIKISNVDLLNNGRNTAQDFAGLYIANDTNVGSNVFHVWISNIRSGNEQYAVGGDAVSHQDLGIAADYGSQVDYIQISMADTRNNVDNGIMIQNASGSGIKTNSHVSFSYNLTSWIAHNP